MKLLAYYRTRKYFVRLLASFTLLVILLLSIFGSLLYAFTRDNTMTLQQEMTGKVLRQVNYNIDNLYDTVAHLTVSALSDRDIEALLHTAELDVFELYNRLNKLDYYSSTNLFVHSLILYNGNNGCYYVSPKSSPVQCEPGSPANELEQLLSTQPEVPELKLIAFEAEEANRHLLSIIKRERNSVIMLNVKPEWLFDNIHAINGLADHALGEIVIVDEQQRVVPLNQFGSAPAGVRAEWLEAVRSAQGPEGYLTIGDGADKKLLMYTTSKATGWRLIGVQDYREVFGGLTRIATYSLLLLAGFIALAILMSSWISLRLYKPISSMVAAIRRSPYRPDDMAPEGDELSSISRYNESMQERLARLEPAWRANASQAKDIFVRRLLLEPEPMAEAHYVQLVQEHGAALGQPGDVYRVLLLRVSRDELARSRAERRLLQFAIGNIARELFADAGGRETLAIDEEMTALIGSASDSEALERQRQLWPERIARLREALTDYYAIELCVSVSESVSGYRLLHQAWRQARQQAEYAMLLGPSATITPELVAANEANEQAALDETLERKWLDSVRGGKLKAIEGALVEVFRQLSGMRWDHMHQSVHYLTAVTIKTIKEANPERNEASREALAQFARIVPEQQALDAIFLLYMELFQQLAEARDAQTDSRGGTLAAALRESVERQYADPNLSLQALAAELRMSPGHLGKLFKQHEGVSIADYMNQVRLTHAMEELRRSDAPVAQIMSRNGYVSESYFYKVFKEKTGLTPREYRMRHLLGRDS